MSTTERYQSLWAEHGPDLKSVAWSSVQNQLTRFNVLRDCYVKPGSVLDVGCGFGDFSLAWNTDEYTGIDSVPEFIDEARRKYPTKTFIVGDIMETDLDMHDYVFASGLLAFQENPIQIIRRLWSFTDNTLTFNWNNAHLKDIAVALDVCQCGIFGIRKDYLPDDYTVYMYRSYQ